MAWVRDQTKVYLADIKEFWLKASSQTTNPETAIMGCRTDWQGNMGAVLGTFSNHEAALEELDRIEKWIEQGATGVYQISGE